jgi:hypothetical protein
MNKFSDASSSRLTAKMNRDRLAVPDRPTIPEEEAKKGIAIRQNMARLRELRLAKEAQEIRAEISTGNRPTKPEKAVQVGAVLSSQYGIASHDQAC